FPVENLELRLDLTETSRILHVPLDQSTAGTRERFELAHQLVRPPARLVERHHLARVPVAAVEDLLGVGDPRRAARRAPQPRAHRRCLVEPRAVELGAQLRDLGAKLGELANQGVVVPHGPLITRAETVGVDGAAALPSLAGAAA